LLYPKTIRFVKFAAAIFLITTGLISLGTAIQIHIWLHPYKNMVTTIHPDTNANLIETVNMLWTITAFTLSVIVLKKTAYLVPAYLLNLVFLGTSGAATTYITPLNNTFIALQTFVQDRHTFYDYTSAFLTLLLISSIYLSFRKHGPKTQILNTIQICSLSFLPLGIEVFLFDNAEWNLHVIQLQSDLNLIPWFSNADLLLTTLTLFTLSTIIKHKLRTGRNTLVNAPPPVLGKRPT